MTFSFYVSDGRSPIAKTDYKVTVDVDAEGVHSVGFECNEAATS